MNPFEAVAHGEPGPRGRASQTANSAVVVFPLALRVFGKWWPVVAFVAVLALVAIVVWAFTG